MKTRRCHIALLVIMVFAMMVSCGKNQKQGPVSSHIDSILFETGRLKQYTHLVELADSFEKSGNLTQLNANRWRGVAYYHKQDILEKARLSATMLLEDIKSKEIGHKMYELEPELVVRGTVKNLKE